MSHVLRRREFLAASAAASLALTVGRSWAEDKKELPFKISLAEWSLNKSIFGKKVDHLDFAKIAKEEFGLDGVEYVNQFFKDKATDNTYLADMKKRADDLGV